MENENTIFGFEAISDIFNENHSNTTIIEQDKNNEELTDEELEELKKQSKNNRPDTPGNKNKKENDPDSKEEQEDETEEEEVIENNNTEETVEDDEDSSKVTALFDAIAEELEWEFEEEDADEKPKTVEDLVKYFTDVIQKQSVPQYASEETKRLDEFVRNGGNLNDYFTVTPEVDYDNFDTTIESNQKQIVKLLLTEKGYSEKQITRKIEKYEDAGILEDEAEDALEAMKEIEENKREKLLADQEKQQQAYQEQQQAYIDNVVNEIKTLDNVRGIKIPEKDKKALLQYIFKTDSNGKTQYQKDYSKSVKNLIESAYFTMKGDTLLNTAKQMGNSAAIKNLKQSLRSTGVGKGTRRINTTSSNSIFSRAVQLL